MENTKKMWKNQGLNYFTFDVSDVLGDVPGAMEWVQLDNGKAMPDLVIHYQGKGGDRFAAFTHGFRAGRAA